MNILYSDVSEHEIPLSKKKKLCLKKIENYKNGLWTESSPGIYIKKFLNYFELFNEIFFDNKEILFVGNEFLSNLNSQYIMIKNLFEILKILNENFLFILIDYQFKLENLTNFMKKYNEFKNKNNLLYIFQDNDYFNKFSLSDFILHIQILKDNYQINN